MAKQPAGRISQITTMRTVLARAHGGDLTDAAAARQLLIERYGGAVRTYLLGHTWRPCESTKLRARSHSTYSMSSRGGFLVAIGSGSC
jgi:hypothetical protein